MYLVRQRTIVLWLILICIFLLLYMFYNSTGRPQVNEIKPSFVLAVKGNKQPMLYSQIRGLVLQNESSVELTKESIAWSKAFLWKNHTVKTNNLINYANTHIWNEICGDSIENFLTYPLFPHLPSSRSTLTSLELEHIDINTGLRIFGYIIPSISDYYQLYLFADSVDVQVWLSSSYKPNESQLVISSTNQRKVALLGSHRIYLKKKTNYYFDVVLKTSNHYGKFKLQWKARTFSSLKTIEKFNLQPYFDDVHYPNKQVILDYKPQLDVPLVSKHKNFLKPNKIVTHDRSNIFLLPFIDEKDIEELFTQCKYNPSYITQLSYQFQGIWETHFSSVYPDDNTSIPYKLHSSSHDHIIFGNPILEENIAKSIANKVLTALQKKHKNKYFLVSILNIEQNHDLLQGDRYLVELELQNRDSSKHVRFSEYVYQPKGEDVLYFPENFKWKKDADVNVILTVGNQGRWAKHFIDTMSRIYTDTKDPHLNVIIVDFNSKDIDIVRALQESSIPRYTLLKRDGKFHKTEAIQAAVNTINNPDAITLQLDLHLVIPSDIIDHVRKHTVQQKMTYSPILARLQCGASPYRPHGFWEISGYGIFGVYKSDWNLFGGMAVEKYREKWGNEDWDLLDRVIMAGYEVERIKIPNFYHVFHTKKGMWQNMA